ncbi:hypothetical protein [Flavobacterium sp. W22_SRS_FP1]|uniref:hypothetical protein n=1 Tax=Flavobacterium sp. W22_SRS_FP1 TaxID=3240276 RepID=UPI003F930811
MKNLIYLTLISVLLASCDSNERNIKKTFNRLNSGETSSASKYVWPEDHQNLYTFEQRFLNQNKLISLDIETINSIDVDGTNAYQVYWNCNNCNEELLSYFKTKNNLFENNKIVDTVFVKTTNGKEFITFDWNLNANSFPDNIKLSSVLVKKLNLRSGPGKTFSVVGQLENGEDILIDDNFRSSSWRKGIIFENSSKINEVYFSSQLSDISDISFFTLDWINSMGVLVLTVIAIIVLFVVYPLLFSALFRAGGEGAGTFALILFFVLLIAVYFTYQIIEMAIFELFIINLPY